MAARIDGADISHWQSGSLDFAAFQRAGGRFLVHKATEGTTYVDPKYAQRRAEVGKIPGLVFGAYHFASAVMNAKAQADWFLKNAKPKGGDFRPMLDIEAAGFGKWSIQQRTDWVGTWVERVKAETGAPPWIYTPFDFLKHFDCPLWVARYSDSMKDPVVRKPWSTWTIWQFSNGVYGKPKSVAGLGNVDLNTMNGDPARLVKTFTLPKKDPTPQPQAKTKTLRFGHASLQFSDSGKQHTADIERLFARGYDVLTGTEAGPGAGNTSDELKRCATKYGYRLSITSRYDTWVAIKASLITGGWKAGSEFALWRSSKYSPTPPGRWGDKGVVWAEADLGPQIGTIAVGAIHTLTWGGTGSKALKDKTDAEYAAVMGKWAAEHGAGNHLAFIGGDFNRSDKTNDLFRGKANMVTCWDDLKKWPNTGHGNIDALARFKPDGRVKCVGARALDDTKVPLNTDHFLIEAEYEIRLLG